MKNGTNNVVKTHFPSPTREWKNSIYAYNKNTLNIIPVTTISAMKFIKNYFSLYNNIIERKMRTKRLLLRFRRLSSNKIYISNGEFKHTNNKVIITLYLYNRQKHNFMLAFKKFYLTPFLNPKMSSTTGNINKNLIKRFEHIKSKGLLLLRTINKDKAILLNALSINNNIKTDTKLYEYINDFYKKIIKKSLRKIKLYLYYKQLIYINKSKFDYTYLQYLKKHLENIYNKNIEFNLINLKRFYLNSDILADSITLKLTKNRRKMLKYMNIIKNKVKTRKKKILLNVVPFSVLNFSNNKISLEKHFINNLKYRHVTGFRLEAKGRLTRRFTASRSTSKLRYKGNLLDIDSSYRGLSSVLLKGNLKSNVQYTKLKSKSRIGSFGIKGWISGN